MSYTFDPPVEPRMGIGFRTAMPHPTQWKFVGRDFRGSLIFSVREKPRWDAPESLFAKPRLIGIPPSVFWDGTPGPDGIYVHLWSSR